MHKKAPSGAFLCISDTSLLTICYNLSIMTPQQQAAEEAGKFVSKVNDIILYPLIALLSGIAFLFFIWGCAVYILNADNDSAREEGKKHMMYGIIGLVVMLSAYTILAIATGTFGLDKQTDCALDPTATGCDQVFKFSP